MQRKTWKKLGGLMAVVIVAGALVGAWYYKLPALAWYWVKMQSNAEEWSTAGVWLPHYEVLIDGRVVDGVEENASGLTFSSHTGTLFSVTNKHPMGIFEIDTEGRLLRRIELKGVRDPEGITHVRDNVFAITDERDQRVYRIEIQPEDTVIDVASAPRLGLSFESRSNLGFEGVSWDSVGNRLFVSQEKAPMRVLAISGLPEILDGSAFNLQIDEWRPANASGLFVTDLSSLTFHEATGNLLLLSDESALVIEYDPNGNPVSNMPLWKGHHGLSRRVPQAEGLAVGPDGTLYVMSEPNLFYSFRRTQPAPWAQ